MLPNAFVGLLLGVGAAAWVYSKMMHRTGNNAQNALIVAGIAGAFAFVAIIVALNAFFPAK